MAIKEAEQSIVPITIILRKPTLSTIQSALIDPLIEHSTRSYIDSYVL